MLNFIKRLILLGFSTLLSSILLFCLGLFFVYQYFAADLPDVETLRDIELQIPLRIYSEDGEFIAEYGEKRRIPVTLPQIPPTLIQAFLSTEDQRFFDHSGVDLVGIGRAILADLVSNQHRQGASTITMQLARNFFLSPEKSYARKIKEIILALKIEQEFSKEKILELYLNKIFLGHRAYGIGAAAEVYYGKPVSELNLAEMAMLAGLPKAPSTINPISNPERAYNRRAYVLRRMREENVISAEQAEQANQAPIETQRHAPKLTLEADYVAEMVRQFMIDKFGEERALTQGYKVYTTLGAHSQEVANQSLRQGLMTYDRRHGYRGPITGQNQLANIPVWGNLLPAEVSQVADRSIQARLKNGETLEIGWKGLSWARPQLDKDRLGAFPRKASQIVKTGDFIYVLKAETPAKDGSPQWLLAQIPEASAAFVAIEADTGAIRALVGGFDYHLSKFNRVTQARRQPGSNIKPFIYAAAMEKGYSPATIINDAPLSYYDPQLEEQWRPENANGKFGGPTRLRVALRHSINLVSIRLLQAIGVPAGIDYLERLGFNRSDIPVNATIALGTMSVTPLELVSKYAIIANGGFKIEPYFVSKITTPDEQLIYQAQPVRACRDCQPAQQDLDIDPELTQPTTTATTDTAQTSAVVVDSGSQSMTAPRVMSAETSYIMDNLLRDVAHQGTAANSNVLKRQDTAGKTGTTNGAKDAWFSGYAGGLVASSWMGFDDHSRSLGRQEFGSHAALPIWIDFMADALKNRPEFNLTKPDNLDWVAIDADTGLAAYPGQTNVIKELIRKDQTPPPINPDGAPANAEAGSNEVSGETVLDSLF